MTNKAKPLGCAWCHGPLELVDHVFAGGGEAWSIVAPLYFAADATGRCMVAGFCSCLCGVKWRAALADAWRQAAAG